MNMDHELRDALRRKQAPADLADRVLARINEQQAPARQTGPAASRLRQGYGGQSVRRWLAAAAVLAVAAGGAERYYTQQQAAEAARVQEELRIALQITSETLAVVQNKLSQPAEDGAGKGTP
jgi:anti-sigma-K factor RskA